MDCRLRGAYGKSASTKVVWTSDTDTGTYVISSGVYEDIGLEVEITVLDKNKQDIESIVELPQVQGSTGSTQASFAIVGPSGILKEQIMLVGNNVIDISMILEVERGLILNEGVLTGKIQAKNIGGTITISNGVGPDPAEFTVKQFIDVVV